MADNTQSPLDLLTRAHQRAALLLADLERDRAELRAPALAARDDQSLDTALTDTIAAAADLTSVLNNELDQGFPHRFLDV
jgi:hypothetical protein